jgi:hypothetical protein
MNDIAKATQAITVPAGGRRGRRTHRNGSCPGRRSQQRAVPVAGSPLHSAMSAPAPAPSLPTLLAALVELGREAWRVSELERAVRAEIQALREIEEKAPWED